MILISNVLERNKALCEEIVNELLETYEYVSLLGVASKGINVRVDNKNISLSDSDTEYGYVIKVYNNGAISEYSFNELSSKTMPKILFDVRKTVEASSEYKKVSLNPIIDQKIERDFTRVDSGILSDSEIVERLTELKDKTLSYDSKIINSIAMFNKIEIAKMFISKNKKLSQTYSWSNVILVAVAKGEDNNIKMARKSTEDFSTEKALDKMVSEVNKTADIAIKLLKAKPIVPGEYDIITDPSITGLIAHEAFGHGVEMDMFVKNRAKGKDYIGEFVASPLISMHDGATSADSVASYFFDDDGVLAHDTLIINNGKLVTGISDMLSALELGTIPTGNGRRESYLRKAYSRMTNTFFSKGESKLDDMIKSIKHGYYLCDTNNGMEDPKNWQIQCTAEYGLEIVDGKFTGNIVSPVVISGYVPDVLKSISMVSNEFEISGSGYCGKGHKEWVRVSDGGPHLKARVKLG